MRTEHCTHMHIKKKKKKILPVFWKSEECVCSMELEQKECERIVLITDRDTEWLDKNKLSDTNTFK